jgi:prepilin-type N-terminal cleavage/methylation domain-containing protein
LRIFIQDIEIIKRNQSGFTLIEIAIVLVVIGILLGGVIVGRELISNAKFKNLVSDFKNAPVYISGYEDKFKALPGDQDQARLDTQFLPAGSATACTPAAVGHCATNNGFIDGGWDATAITDESFLFWQHVRLASFGQGSTNTWDAAYRPSNAVGGYIGITNSAQSPVIGISGTHIVCSDVIPGNLARQLDTTLDDGNTATGSVMVVPAGTPTSMPVAPLATTSLVDGATYLVCMGN